MKLPKLHYFDRSEFIREEDWFTKMSPRLLVLLDTFRHLTGKCIISPNDDAIGRRTKIIDGYYDAHNYVKHGEVQAVDVFPSLKPIELRDKFRFSDLNLEIIAENWINKATSIGFTGIGYYPNWTYKGEQRPGLHLDVRESAKPGEPVTWGRINRDYVSLDKAMEVLA